MPCIKDKNTKHMITRELQKGGGGGEGTGPVSQAPVATNKLTMTVSTPRENGLEKDEDLQ